VLYYQDFKVNSCVVNPHHLILDREKSQFIEQFDAEYLGILGKKCEADCPIEDYLEAIFEILNIYNNALTVPKIRYKQAGHTSMSVGDYVVVYDMIKGNLDPEREKTYMVGAAGWKLIDMPLDDYTANKNKVLERMQSVPVDIILAMASQVYSIEDEDGTFENILDKFVFVKDWESQNGQ